MEMTFPSIGLSQKQSNRSCDHRAILARASARQSGSRTVCLVRQAELATQPQGDDAEQRIHYFADSEGKKMAVCGAFWKDVEISEKSEFGVYQASSAYFKHLCLDRKATGETTNLAGQGTSRTL